MSGIKPLLVGILLAGLFAFALISGGIMLAINNGANQSIGDDPALAAYKASLEVTLAEAETNANASINALGDSAVTEVQGSVIFEAISGVWKTLKIVPVTIYNLTFGLGKTKIFGETFNVVFGIIAAILIIGIIFGVIKMLTSGDDGDNR